MTDLCLSNGGGLSTGVSSTTRNPSFAECGYESVESDLVTTSKCGSSPDSAACSSAALRHSSTTRSMQAIISGNSTLSVSFRSSRSTNHPLAASACAAQYSNGRSTVYPMPGMMSTCLPVSVFFTRFLPHGVTAGVTFFVVGCVPFLPMLCLIRLFVCSVRLGRSLWPASFPILHARRRRLQSFPSVHHALVAELRTDLLRRFRARSGRQQHRGHARLSVRQLNSDKTRSRHT